MVEPIAVVEAAHGLGFPILTALVLTPVLGALVVLLLPERRPEVVRLVGLATSVVVLGLALWLLWSFDSGEAGFQFVSRHIWIEPLGISWHLGVDGISLFLVVLSAVLFPLALLGADPGHDRKAYTAWMLALEAGCIGVFLALDLFWFFVFFEVVLVPMYFIIGQYGHGQRVYASNKFFLYTAFGSAFMLVAIVATVVLTAQATGNPLTFDVVTLANSEGLSAVAGRWLFAGFAIAFAIKVPLFPVHTWLPDAHTEAPTAGSVILAGILLKLGTYGFVRLGVFMFPEAAVWFSPALVTLGVIGIIYGAVVATMQKDLKRLVAYSSVAHLGFIVLGVFALTTQGIQGGVLQMVNHGLSTGALFLLVGWIYERRHTREIAALKGLQTAAPVLAAVFTVVMLSSIGVPGLNGFVGEFLVLLGSFATYRWWAVVAAVGVILAAVYLLWAYQRVFHGPVDDANRSTPDLRVTEGLVIAPLVVLILVLGLWPKPFLDRVQPSVDRLVAHVEARTDWQQPDVLVVQEGPLRERLAERAGSDEVDAADEEGAGR